MAGESGSVDPMHQFLVEPLFGQGWQIAGHNIAFTNSALWMVIAALVVTLLMTVAMRNRALVPGRWQSIAELSYEFIANMIRENVGDEGKKYFPFIFTLFMFILAANLLGMVPYSFTPTSHIVVTFAMAFVVFIGVTLIGFARHGLHFLGFFVPAGVPKALLPLLVVIEVISYLIRPVSLSVRLFANMLAGHITLKVFASFVTMLGAMGAVGWGAAVLPLGLTVALTALELLEIGRAHV